MSRHMQRHEVDPPIWRAVVQLCDGRRRYYGPYPTRGGATQAGRKALREDEEWNSILRLPDPDAPADQPWRTVEHPNPAWKPGKMWHEIATDWIYAGHG